MLTHLHQYHLDIEAAHNIPVNPFGSNYQSPPLPPPPPPPAVPRITMLDRQYDDENDMMSTTFPRYYLRGFFVFPGLPVNESDPRPPTPSGGRPGPLAPRPNVPTPPPTP